MTCFGSDMYKDEMDAPISEFLKKRAVEIDLEGSLNSHDVEFIFKYMKEEERSERQFILRVPTEDGMLWLLVTGIPTHRDLDGIIERLTQVKM